MAVKEKGMIRPLFPARCMHLPSAVNFHAESREHFPAASRSLIAQRSAWARACQEFPKEDCYDAQ
jgi:hypothetical protein